MIKITHKDEAVVISNIPEEVITKAVEITTTLDENYGEERDVEQDLGGYILIAEIAKEVKAIRGQIDIENTLREYLELIAPRVAHGGIAMDDNTTIGDIRLVPFYITVSFFLQ